MEMGSQRNMHGRKYQSIYKDIAGMNKWGGDAGRWLSTRYQVGHPREQFPVFRAREKFAAPCHHHGGLENLPHPRVLAFLPTSSVFKKREQR
jgi:hypothetical protein